MKRALLVGIDNYDLYPNLSGCVNDVLSLEPMIARNEDRSPNFRTQTLISVPARVVRDVLSRNIDALLIPGADVALFYFAGHGKEQANDVVLMTSDATEQSPGVSLSDLLGRVQTAGIREVNIILDCCFSGSAGGVPQLGTSASVLRPGLSILTASRADQTSAETATGRGLFSTHLGGALDGGAADVLGKVTVAGLYAYLSEVFDSWEQRPTFKANIDRPHELRLCTPAVPIEDLRELHEIFSESGGELSLNPSYEPTEEPRDKEKERIFKILQRCRAAKLVDPVGAEHLYFAAVESKSCRLTPLGRHYREMAARGLL